MLQLLVLNKPKKIVVLLFTEVKKSYKNNKTQSTEQNKSYLCNGHQVISLVVNLYIYIRIVKKVNNI